MRCRFRDDAEGKRSARDGEAAGRSRERRTTAMGNDADEGKENRENRPRGRAERIFQRGNFVITREKRAPWGDPPAGTRSYRVFLL